MMKALLVVGAITVFAGVYLLMNNTNVMLGSEGNQDLAYVQNLDIDKYMGRWYVIASKPNIIESNCHCARSMDTRIDEKTIELAETCKIFGKWITSKSKAIIEEANSGRWTNVAYGRKGDYWVIDIESNGYTWSVIG